MIKNERQYRITKAQAERFADALKRAEICSQAEHRERVLRESLAEINEHLRHVVVFNKHGYQNNWDSYYLPLFERLSEKYSAILAKAGQQ